MLRPIPAERGRGLRAWQIEAWSVEWLDRRRKGTSPVKPRGSGRNPGGVLWAPDKKWSCAAFLCSRTWRRKRRKEDAVSFVNPAEFYDSSYPERPSAEVLQKYCGSYSYASSDGKKKKKRPLLIYNSIIVLYLISTRAYNLKKSLRTFRFYYTSFILFVICLFVY